MPAKVDTKLLADAFGDHLSRFPWEWFATLTFRQPQSQASAARALLALVRAMRQAQSYSPGFIAVSELQRARNVPHWHLLLLNCYSLRRLDWKDWWDVRYGFARVMPYDRQLGARHYVGKYLFKECGTVLTSRNLTKWLLASDSPVIRKLTTAFELTGQSERTSSDTVDSGLSCCASLATPPAK